MKAPQEIIPIQVHRRAEPEGSIKTFEDLIAYGRRQFSGHNSPLCIGEIDVLEVERGVLNRGVFPFNQMQCVEKGIFGAPPHRHKGVVLAPSDNNVHTTTRVVPGVIAIAAIRTVLEHSDMFKLLERVTEETGYRLRKLFGEADVASNHGTRENYDGDEISLLTRLLRETPAVHLSRLKDVCPLVRAIQQEMNGYGHDIDYRNTDLAFIRRWSIHYRNLEGSDDREEGDLFYLGEAAIDRGSVL